MGRLTRIAKKSALVIKDDGVMGFIKRGAKYAYYKKFPEKKKTVCKDILFISGCALPHPERFRVYHQIEQLESVGITCDSVFYENLNIDMLRRYRGFVFFRCPVTDTVRQFITRAKQSNKTCFFDVDDLVIDKTYTDTIKFVQQMSEAEKHLYDDGVQRMQETLRLCDVAITTTTQLQTELQKYIDGEVYVNRNVASDEMVYCSQKVTKDVTRDPKKIVIGYFSGSITHNENFELVLPSLVRLLKQYDNLYLKVVGILDIPEELTPFSERLINIPYMEWRDMPKENASCDINIAPLVDTIFNRAKSENKWIEAALVKVPMVASCVGAFKEAIVHNETGILAQPDEWYDALNRLINDTVLRENIANAAYQEVIANHTTIGAAMGIGDFVRSKLKKNIGFVLPSTDISGGVNVVIKHADILQKNGWDVTLFDAVDAKMFKRSSKQYQYRETIPGHNVISVHKSKIETHFDVLVATLWATLEYVKKYPNAARRLYFVQSFETDFYPFGTGEPRIKANATYCDATGVEYITMSLWCQDWLREKFHKEAKYCSNGINLQYYPYKPRDFKGRINILVEGDSRSEYKNTDEAFRVIEKLDPKKYEISYLSYRKDPKDWYRVDHYYNRIAPEKVGEVYTSCDILLKTSLLESFSYPPLEMMATGGIAVVVPNEGNIEYLRDGENCLFYKQGNINDAVAKIEEVVKNTRLRNELIKHGRETAESYEWQSLEERICSLYE